MNKLAVSINGHCVTADIANDIPDILLKEMISVMIAELRSQVEQNIEQTVSANDIQTKFPVDIKGPTVGINELTFAPEMNFQISIPMELTQGCSHVDDNMFVKIVSDAVLNRMKNCSK